MPLSRTIQLEFLKMTFSPYFFISSKIDFQKVISSLLNEEVNAADEENLRFLVDGLHRPFKVPIGVPLLQIICHEIEKCIVDMI